jgi:hypothetical protein
MNEEPERWTIQELDDAAAPIALPPRDGWTPRRRTRAGTKVAAALALAALVLVGIVLVFAEPTRIGVPEPPTTPSPTFSRNDSGTPLPTEAEAWGEIWTKANGVAVLRPMWLPKSGDEYQISPGNGSSRDGLFSYDMSYYERQPRPSPGTIVSNIEFFGDRPPGRGLQQFGRLPETITIRGHAAELYGNGSPGWTLVWSEEGYRYAIQAFAVSREDLLRIADSLAPVIDYSGRTNP